MRESNHGKVETWTMTPEELEEYRKKYPIKQPLYKKPKGWQRISREIYQKYKRNGYSDREICKRVPGLSIEILAAAKQRWGVE